MKVIMRRTFSWSFELPDKLFDKKSGKVKIKKAVEFMELNDAWPSLLDGMELEEAMEIEREEE